MIHQRPSPQLKTVRSPFSLPCDDSIGASRARPGFGRRDAMVANGYEADFADRCFRQIEGFGEYGFPESHAASFALLVYASCWLKCYYPDVFCAALLNAQPMGFYAPAQIVRDAREHGVDVHPPDINLSDWDSTLEPGEPAGPKATSRHETMTRPPSTDRAMISAHPIARRSTTRTKHNARRRSARSTT